MLSLSLSLSLSTRRYTESMMNTYQSMGVPPSASSFAQFYQAANAVSAASAAAIGVGVDSLGNACTQPSSAVVSTAGGGQAITDIPRYPWMTLSGGSQSSLRLIVASSLSTYNYHLSGWCDGPPWEDSCLIKWAANLLISKSYYRSSFLLGLPSAFFFEWFPWMILRGCWTNGYFRRSSVYFPTDIELLFGCALLLLNEGRKSIWQQADWITEHVHN